MQNQGFMLELLFHSITDMSVFFSTHSTSTSVNNKHNMSYENRKPHKVLVLQAEITVYCKQCSWNQVHVKQQNIYHIASMFRFRIQNTHIIDRIFISPRCHQLNRAVHAVDLCLTLSS